MKGILIKAIAGFYYVKSDDKVYECKARGSLRNNELSPVVGDRVEFLLHENSYPSIESIYDRKNCLVRPNVANIDKLFIVSSYCTPAPNTVIIDRLTAICEFYNIEPIIVFNKADLGDFSEFSALYNILESRFLTSFDLSSHDKGSPEVVWTQGLVPSPTILCGPNLQQIVELQSRFSVR